jgi:hypothetical protein
MSTSDWPTEFARVISCAVCSCETDTNLLRDADENVPQPGYIGRNYWQRRVLLVGQNPGTPKTLADPDRRYTCTLRQMRDAPNAATYEKLQTELQCFMRQWPVFRRHFPLSEAGLTLDDVAYFNVVRCRTKGDAKPGSKMVSNCN